MYEVPANTKLEVVDFETMIDAGRHNIPWSPFQTKQQKLYDSEEFIDYVSVTNRRGDNFPNMLKDIIKYDNQMVIFRRYTENKIWFAKVNRVYLNYIG